MAKDKIQPVKKAVSHSKKCQSEVCCSLNTKSTLGPIWRNCFWKKLWNAALSKSCTGWNSGLQRPPASSTLYQQSTLCRVSFWLHLFATTNEIYWLEILPSVHPSLESSGRFALSTHITEQTKLVCIWKDANRVWQCFLCRPDKQEQERGLERWVSFGIELILFSFKNVSLIYI